jgi:hypothetical protein
MRVTDFARLRSVALLIASVALAAWVAFAVAGPSGAGAFSITPAPEGGGNLDGKVVMSPAAERIETTTAKDGERIAPGDTVIRQIVLHNRTEAPIDFDLGIKQVVGSDAELIVELLDTREGAAAWVQLERPTIRLKPGEQGAVNVTVRIPKKVTPGSKPFAITATQRAGTVEVEGIGVAPQFEQAAIFIVELPGDAPVKGGLTEATITSAQKNLAAATDGTPPPKNSRLYVSPGFSDAHRLSLATQYENKGERILQPSGKVVVKDLFGRVVGQYQVPQFSVYPGGEAAGSVEMKGLPSLGLFTVSVELTSEAAGAQSTTLPRFFMVPKWLLALIAGGALWLLWKVARWQLRRRREWKQYLADEAAGGDNVTPLPASDDAWDDDDDQWVDETVAR